LTGKRLEVPLKKLLLGQAATAIVDRDAVANPESLEWFIAFANKRNSVVGLDTQSSDTLLTLRETPPTDPK
jgi:hypothetical protein